MSTVCTQPYLVKQDDNNIPVPCGKCPNCISRRVSNWSFRLMQESKNHITHDFIRLSYDTTNVPISGNGFLSLNPVHLSAFIKRLRANLPQGNQLKFYGVGEYGEEKSRPHYHVIIFGATKDAIQKSWSYGSIHYGETVTFASIGYCLKYMHKAKRIPMHKRDDRVPEFSRMSKGIGKSYLTPEMVAYHKSSPENCFINIEGSKKASMPRYYKDKIYTQYEKVQIQSANIKKQLLLRQKAERDHNHPHHSYDTYQNLLTNQKFLKQNGSAKSSDHE